MQLQFSNYNLEAGCDEAGRGCLAGSVVAAAVILPKNFSNSEINDSKKLNEKTRKKLAEIIKENAICYGIGIVNEKEIDKINILQASILAMHRALENLSIQPDFIAIDGNKFNTYKEIPHQTIVKGDGKYTNIAAASILAKTFRDELIGNLHELHPHYNWKKNKAYGTLEHRNAIAKFGITDYHRKSFKLFDTQLALNLK